MSYFRSPHVGLSPQDDIAELLAFLPEGLLEEALGIIRAIKDDYDRAQMLTALAPALSEQLRGKALREALQAARAIKNEDSREQVLAGLALSLAELPPIVMYSFWCELLHSWASGTRHDMLTDLSALFPVIFALGGAKGVVETCYALLEVGQWWA